MKIRIKQTLDTAFKLSRDGIPAEVVETLLGREFSVTDMGHPFTITAPFKGSQGEWHIAPECVLVINAD